VIPGCCSPIGPPGVGVGLSVDPCGEVGPHGDGVLESGTLVVSPRLGEPLGDVLGDDVALVASAPCVDTRAADTTEASVPTCWTRSTSIRLVKM